MNPLRPEPRSLCVPSQVAMGGRRLNCRRATHTARDIPRWFRSRRRAMFEGCRATPSPGRCSEAARGHPALHIKRSSRSCDRQMIDADRS